MDDASFLDISVIRDLFTQAVEILRKNLLTQSQKGGSGTRSPVKW